MGSIQNRNGMDLTEAEDIKKRWQEYTELYKKDLHDHDNQTTWPSSSETGMQVRKQQLQLDMEQKTGSK